MLMELIRARERGIIIGSLPPGPLNRISDVPGVKVGHCTLAEGDIQTGVTVILPPPENPFIEKLPAAAYVQNGFGKTLGLIQIDELGTLETPIALCGTLNVGRVHDALVSYMVRLCARDGIHLTSVNPVVGECNDGFLSDIQARPCGEAELLAAIAGAEADFPLGSVGAGRGTSCHSLKGGIGSASRQLELDGEAYTAGVLVQTNHGRLADLRLPDGRKPEADFIRLHDGEAPDKGSCMMVLATDAPLSDRQLRRVIRRMPVGLIRLGVVYRPRQRGNLHRLFDRQPHFPPGQPGHPPGAAVKRKEDRPLFPGGGRGGGRGGAGLDALRRAGHRLAGPP